jgi:hypothetical protein
MCRFHVSLEDMFRIITSTKVKWNKEALIIIFSTTAKENGVNR